MEIPARLPPPPLPRSSAAGWWIVFVLLAALQLAANSPVLREYDEGLILAGAAQVAHGAVPYRDFWSMYGPGSFYALAGLDRVFGESVLVGRGFDALARAAIVLLVFALARRRAGVACAAAAAAFAFAWLVGVRDYLFPALPATALALLAVQACARVLARGAQAPTWAWAGPGAAVGLALLFRHDFGVYAGIACLPPLLGAAGGSAARRIAAFAAGALLAASPLVAVLWWQAPLHDLVDDLVRLPLAVYVQNRALPFLAPHELVAELVSARSLADVMALGACLPLGIAAVSVPMALWRRVRPRGMRGGEALVSDALIVLNALLCVKGSVRFEMLHMLPATMVSAALLARFLGEPRPRWLRRAAAAAVVKLYS